MKNKIKLSGFIIGLGVLVGVYFFYDFSTGEQVQLSQRKEAKERELATLQTEFTQLQSFVANIDNIKREFKELNSQLQAALEYMPRSFSLSSLLRKMSMVAENSGVEMINFRPAVQNVSPQVNPGQFYSSINITFDLKGTYPQSMVFFDQLSHLKRIVNIENVRMSVSRDANNKNGPLLTDSNVTIKTYRFIE